jgi:hypothetical protein
MATKEVAEATVKAEDLYYSVIQSLRHIDEEPRFYDLDAIAKAMAKSMPSTLEQFRKLAGRHRLARA